MANRRPQNGDRALILPGYGVDQNYAGTICLVHDECWKYNEFVRHMTNVYMLMAGKSLVEPPWNINKPFWHCTLMDGKFAHVHEDTLEPIDPDAEERDTSTEKGKTTEKID